ncbi:MAG: TlyA family RNA methyltransferase [Alphaproteobacteria bacterium]|nr:TlyA family RNA methyltransferase [Alphaproteobacteria bacterium]
MRSDLALVQQNLADTRTKAKTAIEAGLVFYKGNPVTKPSQDIQEPDQLEIRGTVCPYVSRGGLKLEKALQEFHVDLTGKTVLDIGSSTGGFTDCTLQHGAKAVVAVDVGKDQLAPNLRKKPAVTVYEQTDFRTIQLDKIADCTIAVSDVSFISVTKMISKLKEMPKLEALICLIKPQFECGKEIADKFHGVIKDKKVHEQVLKKVITDFSNNGFYLQNITFSPITGGSGNIEYLAYFTPNKNSTHNNMTKVVQTAFHTLK